MKIYEHAVISLNVLSRYLNAVVEISIKYDILLDISLKPNLKHT